MNLNKRIQFIIITIIIIVAILLLNVFCRLCTNIDNEFDNSIFWNAISSITEILGFIGVIYTLIITEETRVKQNKYELKKEILVEEQEQYRKICYREIENINPRKLIDSLKMYECTENKDKLLDHIYEYQICMNEFPGNIRFFYKYENEKIQQFERAYGEYAIKSSNLVGKVITWNKDQDKSGEIYNQVRLFHEGEYSRLKKKVIELIDERQIWVENELNSGDKE